ncbi:uncharacterized protein LOC112171500 isoform X2 [Rosa chinensis]|uniref:uncharacterized protein LOC112171500 isoform X2 n=1 Tax=Rosa chinensis TaxID=74649 RepID=UPI001AD94B7A|nr:uncharacterized protein LOC112171500 isoform X2 [Rosa chinensis]
MSIVVTAAHPLAGPRTRPAPSSSPIVTAGWLSTVPILNPPTGTTSPLPPLPWLPPRRPRSRCSAVISLVVALFHLMDQMESDPDRELDNGGEFGGMVEVSNLVEEEEEYGRAECESQSQG